jgi:hypothetical protein
LLTAKVWLLSAFAVCGRVDPASVGRQRLAHLQPQIQPLPHGQQTTPAVDVLAQQIRPRGLSRGTGAVPAAPKLLATTVATGRQLDGQIPTSVSALLKARAAGSPQPATVRVNTTAPLVHTTTPSHHNLHFGRTCTRQHQNNGLGRCRTANGSSISRSVTVDGV